MAALDLLVSRLRPDDLILAPHDCYGGTMRLLKARSGRSHCCVRFVDQSNSEALKAALEDVPALVLIETPSNPLMRVVGTRSEARRVGKEWVSNGRCRWAQCH